MGSSSAKTFVMRSFPEKVVLPANRSNGSPTKSPVKIFLGTEPAQFQAERIFLWSIEQYRDPSRVYEIYLMKDLVGFKKDKWTTGFTNYRFAIPYFCENQGKAIYNDVDQIYFSDPGELFDTNLNGHGFLAISQSESSVLLLDCERMGSVWTLQEAQHLSKKALLRKALSKPHLFGEISPLWNSRDEEFRPNQSKLLHFTTLHTQPWRPFPKRFIYDRHPFADVWEDMVHQADKANFQVFSKAQPSRDFRAWQAIQQQNCSEKDLLHDTLGLQSLPITIQKTLFRLIQQAQGTTLLCYGKHLSLDSSSRPSLLAEEEGNPNLSIKFHSPLIQSELPSLQEKADGVICWNWLNDAPIDDIPWILDDIFRCSNSFVFIAVTPIQSKDTFLRAFFRKGPYGQHILHSQSWWLDHLKTTSQRFPDISWTVAFQQPESPSQRAIWFQTGGPKPDKSQPTTWVLLDDQPGNTTQSLGLAHALKWPLTIKNLDFRKMNRIHSFFSPDSPNLLNPATSDSLTPDWPDVVIAAGKKPSRIAKWIKQESQGKTRLVQIGRKGGFLAEDFDLVVTPFHCQQPPHPNRFTSLVPPMQVSTSTLKEAESRWNHLYSPHTRPRILVLVGGNTNRHQFTPHLASQLGKDVKNFTEQLKGTLFVTTSRRTGEEATKALLDEIEGFGHIFPWNAKDKESPYLGLLAGADVLVVTGESESMIAEAAGTNKPLYIYPIPTLPPTLKGRIKQWIVQKAQTRPLNNRGTVRPQQKFELFCSWLISKGWVLPPRNLSLLHQILFERGIAKPFGDPSPPSPRPPYQEIINIIPHIQALFGHQNLTKHM